MKTQGGFELAIAVGLLLTASATFTQTTPSKPIFEVATVKPSPPLDRAKLAAEMRAGRMPRFGPHVTASQAEYHYMSLRDLIVTAYEVKPFQISGPPWLATERFDILAKLPEGTSKEDAPAMLQALLQERFKLAVHRETQAHPVLALVVGKDGPKLKESPPDSQPVDEDAPLKPGEMKVDGQEGPVRITRNADGSATTNMGAKGTVTVRMDSQAQSMILESSKVTMAGFADMLTSMLQMGGRGGRQVVDKTGLKGNYQVAVEIPLADLRAMARSQGINPPMAPPNSGAEGSSPAWTASEPAGGSTVFETVKKLGLKLEPRKAQVEQLVIDHVEKTPTED
jgi:uncharacterized protein (TIGR03435 family)